MTIRLLFILTILTNTTWGQSSASNDILEIVKIGIREKRLPRQLINNVDSIHEKSAKRQYSRNNTKYYPLTIPVQWTKENGLKQGENLKGDKIEVWVWGEEDLFLHDVYWITPSNIKRKGNKTTFDFSTHTWFDKEVKYYKGTVKAKKVSGQWIVRTSRMTETKNTFDAWKKLKEGNER